MITVQKIGSNDQCLCGSGKKYKKCCYLTREVARDQSGESLANQQLNELKKKIEAKNPALKEVAPEINMSSVISDFTEEMYDRALTVDEKKHTIRLGILFWNLVALLSVAEKPEDHQRIVNKALSQIPSDEAEIKKNFDEVLDYFIKRKQEMFADIQTIVFDYKIDADQKGGVYFFSSIFACKSTEFRAMVVDLIYSLSLSMPSFSIASTGSHFRYKKLLASTSLDFRLILSIPATFLVLVEAEDCN